MRADKILFLATVETEVAGTVEGEEEEEEEEEDNKFDFLGMTGSRGGTIPIPGVSDSLSLLSSTLIKFDFNL